MAGLYLRKSLDYEVTQVHNLTVVVTDQGLLPQKQATSTVMVTVEDVNDNQPVSGHIFFPSLFFSKKKIILNVSKMKYFVLIKSSSSTFIHWLLIKIWSNVIGDDRWFVFSELFGFFFKILHSDLDNIIIKPPQTMRYFNQVIISFHID